MTHRPTSLAQLARVVAKAVKMSHAKIAIAGGVAVRAYGYHRETADIDVLLRDKDRHAFFAALRAQRFAIAKIMAPYQYAAQKPGDPIDIRIDLLFPAGNVEADAIDAAKIIGAEGERLRVAPIEHIIAMKVIAHTLRREPTDYADIRELYGIGAFDPTHVRAFMLTLNENYVAEFDAIVRSIREAAQKGSLGATEWLGLRKRR